MLGNVHSLYPWKLGWSVPLPLYPHMNWHYTKLLSKKNVLSFLTYNLPGLRPRSITFAALTLAKSSFPQQMIKLVCI